MTVREGKTVPMYLADNSDLQQGAFEKVYISNLPAGVYQGKTVVFFITQSGTSDPVIVEVRNDFTGVTFTPTRIIDGNYQIVADSAIFDPLKTIVLASTPAPLYIQMGDPKVPFIWAGILDLTSTDTIEIATGLFGNPTITADDLMGNGIFLQATVYP